MPPLAKFAAAPFGIVERLAEAADGPALLPVTLRKVEAALRVQGLQPGGEAAPAGKVSTLRPENDADIIAWFRKVQRYDNYTVSRKQARRDVKGALPQVLDNDKQLRADRAWCRCSRASRACARWTCPSRSAPTRARSRWWAFR